MELWMKYALVAAVFIAIRDVFSSKIARKYNYIDYYCYIRLTPMCIMMNANNLYYHLLNLNHQSLFIFS